MRILSYSPSVEAYIAVKTEDGVAYYDVSPDITKCSISRNVDGASTFDINLQNKNGKYNNLFTPMDRITIYATKKGERIQMLTGYIKKVTRFTLYPQDFNMSGACSIYKLQKTYWDKGLEASVRLIAPEQEFSFSQGWTNYANLITKLVYTIGGIGDIAIGQMPQEIVEWAKDLYASKEEEVADFASRINEFYEVLNVTNQADGYAVVDGEVQQAKYAGIEGAVKWMLKTADDESVGYSWGNRALNPDVDCSSFVYFGLLKGGGWTTQELGTYPFATSNMTPILENCGFTKCAWNGSASSLVRGDIMWVHNSAHQHTEMYIGNNQTVGAHSAEDGGVYGQGGDQTGSEVCVVPLSSAFTHYFRYTGKKG